MARARTRGELTNLETPISTFRAQRANYIFGRRVFLPPPEPISIILSTDADERNGCVADIIIKPCSVGIGDEVGEQCWIQCKVILIRLALGEVTYNYKWCPAKI